MRATVSDIARATGLAPGTVSRALDKTGKYYVSAETRRKVEEAAKELRYRPNLIGRALVGGSTKLISLLCALPFSPYYSQVGRWLSSYAAQDGYTLVMNCAYDPDAMPEISPNAPQFPRQDWLFGVDGIVLCDPEGWQRDYIHSALDMHIPVVEMGLKRHFDSDAALIDLYPASLDLMEHLIGQGRRSIVFLTDEGSAVDGRGVAYRQAMATHRLPGRVREVITQSRPSGRAGAIEEITENGAPEAIFCANDALAIGCCRGILDLGYGIPTDIAVAGCDGVEDTDYLACPVTTIVQPVETMCKTAWEFLRSRIEGYEGSPRVTTLEGRLTVRRSTMTSEA